MKYWKIWSLVTVGALLEQNLRELLISCLGNDQQVHVQKKRPKDGHDVLGEEKQNGKCPNVKPKDILTKPCK